jgi:glycosyltransferase involved in cell wall biosynthesis
MQDHTLIKQQFTDLNCCVIIPTYNNDKTLTRVIQDILSYTDNLIVVNDGSTDTTVKILDLYPDILKVNIALNTGKGQALQKGFDLAIEKKFRYAITIDSDGQHYADDLPKFIEKIEEEPDSVIIGARNMDQSEVPGTSNFGHRFSIFWFKIETGLKVDDVQSGYRLYPLNFIKDMHLYTRKYEFEVEVLVRLAWRGVRIHCIPVKVYYFPKEERVSHFRKVHDFTRISIVNSILVFMALLLVRPFLFAKGLKKHSVKGFIREYVINSNDSNARLSFSLGLGLFIGLSPFWGWQMMIAFGAAHFLKLNKFIAVAASNISIPPLLPFIFLLSYTIGGWVLGTKISHVKFVAGFRFAWLKENLLQYVTGSVILGLVMAFVFGLIAYLLLQFFRKSGSPQVQEADSQQVNH